jgi:hypothetical protein
MLCVFDLPRLEHGETFNAPVDIVVLIPSAEYTNRVINKRHVLFFIQLADGLILKLVSAIFYHLLSPLIIY